MISDLFWPDGKTESPRPLYVMNSPDEIIAEIISLLTFDSVNAAALTCAQFARVVRRLAINIADKNAKFCCGSYRLSDHSSHCRFESMTLPNGTLHGAVKICRDMSDPSGAPTKRDVVLFRVEYVLGTPTYWRALDTLRAEVPISSDNLFDYTWGHMTSPYYVTCDDVGGSGEICANVRIGKRKYLSCDQVGPTDYWRTKNGMLCEVTDFAPDIMPPAQFLADGNICLGAVEVWGRQVLCAAIKKWSSESAIRHRPPTFFENDRGLAAIIRDSLPGMRGRGSPIWAPK